MDDKLQALLQKGELFEGVMRYNAKFRNRAYVRVPGFDLDVLIDRNSAMNRTLDSDKVVIRLDQPARWKMLDDAKINEIVTA